ncbi:hypothetical protein VQ056_18190 [Paenibacillus sp. JTLBN-2024]
MLGRWSWKNRWDDFKHRAAGLIASFPATNAGHRFAAVRVTPFGFFFFIAAYVDDGVQREAPHAEPVFRTVQAQMESSLT